MKTILDEADRMAAIVRKLGGLTRYETKSYVGGAQIIDLDRSAQENLASAAKPISIDRTPTPKRTTQPMKPEQMTETWSRPPRNSASRFATTR